MAKDVVCSMQVDENKTQHQSTHAGEKYYFCSADCKKAFDLAPEKYIKKK